MQLPPGIAGSRCRHESWRWSLILLICDTTAQENLKAVSWVKSITVALFQFFFFFLRYLHDPRMSLPNKTGNIFRVFFVDDYHTIVYYPWYHNGTLKYTIVNHVKW